MSQVAYVIAGADVTVSMASEGGQLQLNAFEPVIAHTLMQNSTWLRRAARTLRVNCVTGITANEERLQNMVATSVGVITALIPVIGYAPASKLAKEALASNANVADLVVERGLLTREEVEAALQPKKLSGVQPETGAIQVISPEDLAQREARLDSHDRLDLS